MSRDNADDYVDDVDLSRVEPEDRTEYLKQRADTEEEFPGDYDGSVSFERVTNEMLRNDADNPESWLQYNGNLGQTGYSPADRLTPDNVDGLSKAYEITTDKYGLETNMIVVPGDPPEMYFTSKKGLIEVPGDQKRQNRIVVNAVNARTGEKIWTTNYQYPKGSAANNQVNRGPVVYGDKVFIGTLDTKIAAFNRSDGSKAWQTDVLLDGQSQERTYISQAPLAMNGKIVFGQGGDTAGWSVVGAVDAESGDLLWTTRTAERDGWIQDTWKFSSAGAWMTPAADAETDTVFFSVGNPNPAYNGVVRPGPNPHSNAIVALDAESGEMKWANQISPHELWDWDVHVPPHVFDIEVDGEQRRAVSVNWKAGWTYVLDAETGELLTRTAPFGQQGGEAFFRPPPRGEENAATLAPTNLGATEWPPDSYSPRTGLNYVGGVNVGETIWSTDWSYDEESFEWAGGGTSSDTGSTTAHVIAQSPATGMTEWTFQLPDVEESWPSSLAFTGGTSTTGGGLVFHGSSGHHLYALDDETGDQLWSADTGGRITASPVVWDDPDAGDSGKEFVGVASNNRIVVYAGSGQSSQ